MNDVERHAVFFIADISGYTKFIFSNEKEISHSQMVIRELITSMLEEVSFPLQLIRIEGDAIFLYATKDDDGQSWEQVSEHLVSKVMALFRAFTYKLAELMIHKVCSCTACINIEALKLKIVVTVGEPHSIGSMVTRSSRGPVQSSSTGCLRTRSTPMSICL